MSNYIVREIDNINRAVTQEIAKAANLAGQCLTLESQIVALTNEFIDLEHKKEIYLKSIEILDVAQQSVRTSIKDGFENIVTYALQYVFGLDYVFELDFGRKGNLQEVNFQVKSSSLHGGYDPVDTSGGGVLDVVSLALRVAILELHKPRIEGPIILDESFKHLSRQYLQSAGGFLEALADRVGRQIIIVTHQPEIVKMADMSIEIGAI